MALQKLTLYTGQDLPGESLVTLKLDGVQVFLHEGVPVSRKLKPLYGIDPKLLKEGVIYEAFCGSFTETIERTRSHDHPNKLKTSELVPISPPHSSLVVGFFSDLTPVQVSEQLEHWIKQGYEGLVIYNSGKMYKVKPHETYDVPITGLQPGRGKHKGRLGAFLTPMGKVGTGFTDKDREELNDPKLIGTMVEVECMFLTADGKFRHPRFKRMRYDK